MKEFKKDYPLSLSLTKVPGLKEKYNLSDLVDRQRYFKAKVGKEIEELKEYFDKNSFIAYWLGKKNSGKGTYSKLLMEIFGKDRIGHISIGDVVRDVHSLVETEEGKTELINYLQKDYRGYISIEDCIDAILNRSQDKISIPDELLLSLVKREIDQHNGKILFIDGFPRTLDQVSYSLYFRTLIDYREDQDIFIAIDIPESVIDERMKYRVVCPQCHTPRNIKLFATEEVGHDKDKDEFYLICDNPECKNMRMGAKEGDNLGIESVRERLELDDELIAKVFSLHGIPKILLRNSIPVKEAKALVDDYEITPEYYYKSKGDKVVTKERPFTVSDDEGVESYSLLAPSVIISLIKQLHFLFLPKNN